MPAISNIGMGYGSLPPAQRLKHNKREIDAYELPVDPLILWVKKYSTAEELCMDPCMVTGETAEAMLKNGRRVVAFPSSTAASHIGELKIRLQSAFKNVPSGCSLAHFVRFVYFSLRHYFVSHTTGAEVVAGYCQPCNPRFHRRTRR